MHRRRLRWVCRWRRSWLQRHARPGPQGRYLRHRLRCRHRSRSSPPRRGRLRQAQHRSRTSPPRRGRPRQAQHRSRSSPRRGRLRQAQHRSRSSPRRGRLRQAQHRSRSSPAKHGHRWQFQNRPPLSPATHALQPSPLSRQCPLARWSSWPAPRDRRRMSSPHRTRDGRSQSRVRWSRWIRVRSSSPSRGRARAPTWLSHGHGPEPT